MVNTYKKLLSSSSFKGIMCVILLHIFDFTVWMDKV